MWGLPGGRTVVRMPRTLSIAGLALGCAIPLLAAAAAPAAQLSLDGGTLTYRAAAGEANAVIVRSEDAGELRFTDDHAISFPDGLCRRAEWDDATVARCAFGGPVRVEAGDGADRVSIWNDLPAAQPFTVDGGPGDDTLLGSAGGPGVTFLGGDGADTLTGGSAEDQLDGGPGPDVVEGGFGRDAVRGGDGDDRLLGDGLKPFADLIDGGAGRDTIVNDWLNDHDDAAISVTLDGVANDGLPGEGDDVRAVEQIQVNQPATLAAGGDAVVFRVFQTGPGSSRLTGSDGADTLISYDYADTIDARGGDDTIEAGLGDDAIVAGPGRDTVNADAGSGACNFLVCRAGSGNDTIDLRDGEADSVVCGPGQDKVLADPQDTVAADCETVERSGQQRQDDGRRNDDQRRRAAARRCVVPKVRRGVTLTAAKRALTRGGCRATVRRVRSAKVRRGRVVRLSQRAGRRLAWHAAVRVEVARGR